MTILESLRESNVVLVGLLCLAVCAILRSTSSSHKANVPVVGSSLLFGYVGAIKALTAFPEYLRDGYNKYDSRPFQMPTIRDWQVFVSGKYMDELRKAPEDTLSFMEEMNDVASIRYTLGPSLAENMWHTVVIRKQLIQNLGAIFPPVYDEIAQAFEDLMQLPSTDWKAIHANDLAVHVVCRATNRMMVGLPLCREPRYLKIAEDFTFTVMAGSFIITSFPPFLRSLVGRFLTKVPAAVREFGKYIEPMVEARKRMAAEYGEEWKDKPNDFLQGLIEAAVGDEGAPKALTIRVLSLNFAAIHTTSMTFTHVLYYIAAYPQYAPPLRDEVMATVKEHGWSKAALDSMTLVDSFVKECMRISGIGVVTMNRKVMKPFTFSDGSTLPIGAHVSANAYSIHRDPSIYSAPETFDPFRFSRYVERGESSAKHLLTGVSSDFLGWGGGRHPCLGRYFAAQELKAMLAHIVLHYEVRMPQDGVRPTDQWIALSCVPDRKAEVLYRRRAP